MGVNRLGIFTTLCEDGEIDACNLYLAQNIKEAVSQLVIVVNGQPAASALAELERVTDRVFIRNDTGYDCGAFKQALEEFIGWEEVRRFEELLLANDSCYGPIYPLEEMFGAMQDKPLDFWGVTEQIPVRRNRHFDDLYPYHVQPYFLVVRSKMLRSREFEAFWDTLKLSDIYTHVVENYELRFTEYFNSLGYRSGAYIDCAAFCSSIEETHAYIFFDSYRLIAEHRCPLLKKKVFLFPPDEVLVSNAGETARKTLDYVAARTEYDTDLIWRHLIRKCSSSQLRTSLHLNYICSTTIPAEISVPIGKKAAVVVCVHDPGFLQRYFQDLKGIGNWIDVAVVTDRQNAMDWLAQYPYFCVISDRGITGGVLDQRTVRSCMYSLLENTVASEAYMTQVLSTFETNQRLGLLSVPMPYASSLFTKVSELSGSFWCRTDAVRPALRKLSAAELDEMDVSELVRGAGYYSGLVMTEEYASLYSCNYQFMMNGLIRNVLLDFDIGEFRNMYKVNPHLLEFCEKKSERYIYGDGEFGYRCFHYLQERGIEVCGFLVSDGYRLNEHFMDRPVYEVSEFSFTEATGVLVALNEKNTQAAISVLREKGFQSYIRFSE